MYKGEHHLSSELIFVLLITFDSNFKVMHNSISNKCQLKNNKNIQRKLLLIFVYTHVVCQKKWNKNVETCVRSNN